MLKLAKRLVKEESGQAMTEYGLLIALIAIVVIVAVGTIGTNLNGVFEDVAGKLVGLGE